MCTPLKPEIAPENPQERFLFVPTGPFREQFRERPFGRADRIRTCDPLTPSQVRYQAAPQPAAFTMRFQRAKPAEDNCKSLPLYKWAHEHVAATPASAVATLPVGVASGHDPSSLSTSVVNAASWPDCRRCNPFSRHCGLDRYPALGPPRPFIPISGCQRPAYSPPDRV